MDGQFKQAKHRPRQLIKALFSTFLCTIVLGTAFQVYLGVKNGGMSLHRLHKSEQTRNASLLLRDLSSEMAALRKKLDSDLRTFQASFNILRSKQELQEKLSLDMSSALAEQGRDVNSQNDLLAQQALLLAEQRTAMEAAVQAVQQQSSHMEAHNTLLHKQVQLMAVQLKELDAIKHTVAQHSGQSQLPGASNISSSSSSRSGAGQGVGSWQQQTFVNHGTYGFVQFSSYRLSMYQFVTLGLAALRLRDSRKLNGCKWINAPDGSIVHGQMSAMFPEEHHDLTYETILLFCTLAAPSGVAGGTLVGRVDREEVVLLEEASLPRVDPAPPYAYDLTVCGPPLYGAMEGSSVWEWLEYNRVALGVSHFHLYSTGALDNLDAADPLLAASLAKYAAAGMLTLTHVRGMTYDVWSYAQGLFAHDCLYRHRLTSTWLMMIDLDEYVAAVPPLSLASLLLKYRDKPWLTHQAVWWSPHHCNDREAEQQEAGLFAVERLVYHWPMDYCQRRRTVADTAYCLTDQGHRKFIVNPRKVVLLAIHHIRIPEAGGVDLHVNAELRHHHYQGLNVKGRRTGNLMFCKYTHKAGEKVQWWKRDDSVANMIPAVRACPFGNKACVHQLHD